MIGLPQNGFCFVLFFPRKWTILCYGFACFVLFWILQRGNCRNHYLLCPRDYFCYLTKSAVVHLFRIFKKFSQTYIPCHARSLKYMFCGQILQRIPLKPGSKKKIKNCPVVLNSFDRCCLRKYFSPMRAGLCASSSVNCQMDQNTQPLFLLGNVLIAWHQ